MAEAIVNAVAHRDYASNASVHVMLFADRLEVWNPGELSRQELWAAFGLKDIESFRKVYLEPAIAAGLIEMTSPEAPKSSKHENRRTALGHVRAREDG